MKRLVALIILLLFISSAVPAGAYDISPKVSVEISPNSELFSVVYYLAFGRSDPFIINRGSYLDDVDSYFGAYKNHQAVKMLRERLGYTGSIPQRDMMLFNIEAALLMCSEPPGLKPMVPVTDRWLLSFLDALRDFAEKTDFMTFYDSHRGHYRDDLEIYINALGLLPPDGFMGRYINISGVRFEFLHPYLVAIHGHSFNPKINGTQIYGAGGMPPLVRRVPQRTEWSYRTARDTMFGLPLNRDFIRSMKLDELNYLGFIYHELGHDITTGALWKSGEALLNLTYLESTIEKDMPYLARYDIHFWGSFGMIYEGFADGWEDFALSHVNENYTQLAMWMQRAWGEFWIDETVDMYEKYTNMSLREGKSLTDYVQEMAKELGRRIPPEKAGELYQERVPVTPLRALDRGAVKGKVIIIYGTRNPDPKGVEYDEETAGAVADYLRTFYSQWPENVDVEVKADINVTGEELKENLVLVGGPVANKVVAEMQSFFPLRFMKYGDEWVLEHRNWKVTSFILTGNNILEGENAGYSRASVIMAIRNPLNPENYIIWIAGADRYGTRLYRNPTYYLSSYEIFTGKEIEMGFYVQPLASS
ncbi:CGP-CTERM sorting domain-containing protein [Thermococcus atlanticus]